MTLPLTLLGGLVTLAVVYLVSVYAVVLACRWLVFP